ncbi:MAG: HAMP domain-containing histidine kinase [Spirochaetaceae bacterium]
MKKHSDDKDFNDIQNQIIGLGTGSFRKNYYTALRKSYGEQERFRKIIDRLSVYLIILDSDYRIVDSNGEADTNLNLLDEYNIYKDIKEILPDIYSDIFVHNKSYSLWEGEEETQGIREVHCEELEIDNITYSTLVFRDITHRIKIEQRLEKLVSERTKEIREAQQQLVFAEKMAALGELVAGVSHEINTPIGIGVTAASHIKVLSEEILEGFKNKTLTKGNFESILMKLDQSSDLILSNLLRAAELVQSFKKVAVDQQVLDVRMINIKDYLNDITRSLHTKWKAHSLEIIGNDETYIMTIPGVWSQIISNFIINSIIHGFTDTDNGKIEISFKNSSSSFVLNYTDNGVGIGNVNPDKIFEPFYTTKKESGGNGLGMHIVYNLVVKSLKGKIEYIKLPHRGISFRITIPN